MKTVSFYDKATGLFNGSTFGSDVCTEINIARHTPEGHCAVEGRHDHLSNRVDLATGQVVDYQPPAPSADHEWNATTKRWDLSAAAQAKAQAEASAIARIAELEASQHTWLRKHALGDDAALLHLQAIDDEIASLQAESIQ